MGRLFVHIGMSLDGYVDDADGMPVFRPGDPDLQRYLDEMLASIDAMVFGRTAFEQLAEYWPTADDTASPAQVQKMNGLPKYVLSHSDTPTAWHNSHLLGPDADVALSKLKAASKGDIAVFAGASAARVALLSGTADELRILLHPAVLGGTTRLFDGSLAMDLSLVESRAFRSGVVLLRYEMA